jgi:hypothetical protein
MNIEEIKRAVDAGKKVKWANDLYDVVKGQYGGEYLIVCRPNGSTIGLHGKEGTDRESHLNGDEDEFYVAPSAGKYRVKVRIEYVTEIECPSGARNAELLAMKQIDCSTEECMTIGASVIKEAP